MKKGPSEAPNILKVVSKIGIMLVCLSLIVALGCGEKEEPTKIKLKEKISVGSEKTVGKVLNFGASGSGSPQKIFKQYTPLTEYIDKKLGRRVKLVQKRTYEELNELFKKGEITFGRIATGGYIRLKKEIDIDILALVAKHGDPHYKAVIIVLKDSPITSFDQLRGKTFAFVDRFSNSGFNYPSYLVAQKGSNIYAFFSTHMFSGGHDKSIMAVLNKDVDGASVSSTSLLRAGTKNPEVKSKIKVIRESPLFVRGPVVVKAEMPWDFKKRLREIMFKMHLDEDGRNALKAMKIDRFIQGKDSDFDTEREMLGVVNKDKGKK
jgi:phosphonate transport system substrate-binding protein